MLRRIGDKIRSISLKAYGREILALLMVMLAVVFFRSERKEMRDIVPQLFHANHYWIIIGTVVTAVYILLQSGIYRKSFRAIGMKLPWFLAIELFLKRNLIGVFLPAGSLSALAYTPAQLRKQGFSQVQVHQASAIFGFVSLLSVIIVGSPVILYTAFNSAELKDAWAGLLIVFVILILLYVAVISIQSKGWLFQRIEKTFPSSVPMMEELFAANVSRAQFGGSVLYSTGVEITGILHVAIAMVALGVPVSWEAAAVSYIVAVILMIVSPFLRGLGAVELSMVYVLEQFGYPSTTALSITFLFRVFEFWLPLLAGIGAYAWKGRKIFLRLAPVFLSFSLGLVNIISVVTPPMRDRLRLLRDYLPLETIHASNFMVLFIGLALLATSAFLLRGLRNAWLIALVLSVVSLVGHLTKALDYEEATLAFVTILTLVASRHQYRIRSSNKWMKAGIRMALINFAAVLVFGFASFYFIDKKHFGEDFTLMQSMIHTLKIFLLVDDDTLHPMTRFGKEFIWLVRITGFLTWAFLLYSIVRPYLQFGDANETAREKARFLLSQFGNSSTDYFKVYRDKLYFFSGIHEGFVAYRVSGGFAVVLEEPVCAEENKVDVLREFEHHCKRMGLKPAFYRVDENSIPWFNQMKKQKLLIGQEAILDISSFSLEGKDRKSLRNGLNSLKKKNYTTDILVGPHTDETIRELRNVSDQWLESFDKEEMIFSQGMFDEQEIRQQDLIILKDEQGSIKAFLNIIPDYAEGECTYDLIRKTDDAPGAAMDALIIALIDYAKGKDLAYINLGLVPMVGISRPENTAEQIIKFASERVKRFRHYKGLREFKEKYATYWENKYLVYDNDFDLLQLPVALNNVMKP